MKVCKGIVSSSFFQNPVLGTLYQPRQARLYHDKRSSWNLSALEEEWFITIYTESARLYNVFTPRSSWQKNLCLEHSQLYSRNKRDVADNVLTLKTFPRKWLVTFFLLPWAKTITRFTSKFNRVRRQGKGSSKWESPQQLLVLSSFTTPNKNTPLLPEGDVSRVLPPLTQSLLQTQSSGSLQDVW